MVNRFPMLLNGERVWVEFIDTGAVRTARVDNADAMLFSTRQLADFAESYFRRVLVFPLPSVREIVDYVLKQ